MLERSCIFVIFCESFYNGLFSLFTVDVWLILVFGLCILCLQNGIIGSKWVRVQTYFWWKQNILESSLYSGEWRFSEYLFQRRGASLWTSASGRTRWAEKEPSAGWMSWLLEYCTGLALLCLPVPRAQWGFLNCGSKRFPAGMLWDGINGINCSFPLLLEV